MSISHLFVNELTSAYLKRPVEATEGISAWGSYRTLKFANFTREVNDFPNATVSISLGASAGWVELLAGITNLSVGIVSATDIDKQIEVNQIVGTGIFSGAAKRIPFGQSAHIGSGMLEGFDQGYLAGNVLYVDPQAMDLFGNVQQITMFEPVDSGKLAHHAVIQEYSLSAQLRRLRKLQSGWDGDSAPGIAEGTGDTAEEVIKQLHGITLSHLAIPTTHLAPVPDGNLRFEITHANKELFLTISNKVIEIQAWQPLDAVESFGYWKTDAAGVREHLEWLVK